MKCKTCGQLLPKLFKTIEIKELNIEVEREYNQKDLRIKDLTIPKGWRLLTLNEFLVCYNKYRKKFKDLDKTDEVVQNPIDGNKKKRPYWNVWFVYLVDRSGLGGGRGLDYDGRVRGVRFCRDFSKKLNQKTMCEEEEHKWNGNKCSCGYDAKEHESYYP